MSRRLITLPVLLLLAVPGFAQDRQLPYQAEVIANETYARSGGGERYYPTMSLKRGDTVKVLRHDPGGWYMIEPPRGSFSWVPSRYVRGVNGATGEITDDNVAVFVGSAFGDETSVWQRNMRAGEKVTILGQQTLDTQSGPMQMYKIAPPKREFRWVKGSDIVPTDKSVREARDRNPYEVPSEIAREQKRRPAVPTARSPEGFTTPDNTAPSFAPSRQLAKLKRVREEQRALLELDQKFRFMITSPASEWDLDQLEQDYLNLQQKLTHKPLSGQIDLRYPAIYRYRQRKAQIEEFNRLTSATEKRDSQLMAQQYGMSSPQLVQSTPPLYSSVPQLATGETGPVVGMGSVMSAGPVIGSNTTDGGTVSTDGTLSVPERSFGGGSSVPTITLPEVATGDNSTASNVPANSKYIGAGFLQRGAGENSNEYLLTSPSGKVLARVTPDKNVDMEKYVGTSVGLQGKRWFDPQVKTDRIEVSGLEPVRIRN
ncbi:MAG: SH3 domain-containing protein [Planctomycetaceae bacterium]|nr:SH3 domain-containing protein [Planctomycetaceae bacterium]